MIILDSSFIIAFHNSRDLHHPRASAVMGDLLNGEWGEALLPEYVFLEVTTVLAARRNITVATAVGKLLLSAKEVAVIPCSPHFNEAWTIFHSQKKIGLSFVDAAILAIAQHYKAEYIASFDRGFRREGKIQVIP